MGKMAKVLALLTVLAMASAAFVACGGGDDSSAAEGSSVADASTPDA